MGQCLSDDSFAADPNAQQQQYFAQVAQQQLSTNPTLQQQQIMMQQQAQQQQMMMIMQQQAMMNQAPVGSMPSASSVSGGDSSSAFEIFVNGTKLDPGTTTYLVSTGVPPGRYWKDHATGLYGQEGSLAVGVTQMQFPGVGPIRPEDQGMLVQSLSLLQSGKLQGAGGDGGSFYSNSNLGTAVSSNSNGEGYVATGDGSFVSF